MRNNLLLILCILLFSYCTDPSYISIQNKLPKAVMKNVEWGGIPLASQIAPGQTSRKFKIYENSFYDISFPAENPLKFFIDVNGDRVYVQTRSNYKLGKKDDITIIIEESTPVFNPLTEK